MYSVCKQFVVSKRNCNLGLINNVYVIEQNLITMKNIFFALTLLIASFSFGQNTGCNYPQSNQFDYWVGEWNVYDTLGNKVGENRIEKQYENCVLQENWTSQRVNKGTSYNYYNPTDSTWNQLWLDNQGSILQLKGHYSDNKMVMKSELQKGNNIALYYNQISWVKNEDGTVSQIWEVFDDKGKFLQLAFYGVYKKKE